MVTFANFREVFPKLSLVEACNFLKTHGKSDNIEFLRKMRFVGHEDFMTFITYMYCPSYKFHISKVPFSLEAGSKTLVS